MKRDEEQAWAAEIKRLSAWYERNRSVVERWAGPTAVAKAQRYRGTTMSQRDPGTYVFVCEKCKSRVQRPVLRAGQPAPTHCYQCRYGFAHTVDISELPAPPPSEPPIGLAEAAADLFRGVPSYESVPSAPYEPASVPDSSPTDWGGGGGDGGGGGASGDY